MLQQLYCWSGLCAHLCHFMTSHVPSTSNQGMERPPLSIRSTKGCWTCRLRKKKCDEVCPGCLRCASVNIDCHYGVKPQWIEDPVIGRRELERVKKLVVIAANRKRAEHRAKSRATSDTQSISQDSLLSPQVSTSNLPDPRSSKLSLSIRLYQQSLALLMMHPG